MKIAVCEYTDNTTHLWNNLFAGRIVKEIRISTQIVLDLLGLKSLDDVVDENVAHEHPWHQLLDTTYSKLDLQAGVVGTLFGAPVTTDAYETTTHRKLPGRSILVFYEEA